MPNSMPSIHKETAMKALTQDEIQFVSGGDGVTNSEANQVIGRVIGEAWHGLSSVEGVLGMALGPGGMIAGSLLHYKLHH